MTTIQSAALMPLTPVFPMRNSRRQPGSRRLCGLTRDTCELALRQHASWWQQHHLALIAACRADIECFARDLEARGHVRAGRWAKVLVPGPVT